MGGVPTVVDPDALVMDGAAVLFCAEFVGSVTSV